MAAEGKSDRGSLCRLAAEAGFTNPRITNIQRWFAREESDERFKRAEEEGDHTEAWICGHPDIYADDIK
jgi:hypothetical protein